MGESVYVRFRVAGFSRVNICIKVDSSNMKAVFSSITDMPLDEASLP